MYLRKRLCLLTAGMAVMLCGCTSYQFKDMEALYGRDIEEDRFINYHYHMGRIWICIFLAIIVLAASVLTCAEFVCVWQQGYVVAIGEKADGTRFIGLVESADIKAELQKTSADELIYNSIQTCDLLIAVVLPIALVTIVVMILFISKVMESQKFIRRKHEYDRIQKLKNDEHNIKKAEGYDYAHKNAPEIMQGDGLVN